MKQPRIALLVIGDGRDHLKAETVRSFARATASSSGPSVVVDVDDRDHRLGFGGAIQHGWELLRDRDDFDYVFHLEEDWRFDRPLELAAMSDVLDAYPALAQVALRRGPVNATERAAGGVVEMWPDEYLEKAFIDREAPVGARQVVFPWLEHGLYFTTNPSLYSRSLIDRLDWPDCDGSEAAFTHVCRTAGYRFALWGSRLDGPWITHTGTDRRTGTGY